MKLSGSLLLALFLSIGTGTAAGVKEVAPADATKGAVGEWKTADGLAYQFIIPKSYDEDKGANLTFILHGSNLSRSWGFANHKAGDFRPDDIVISPDGTTANGKGGFNFLGKDADIARFESLQTELSEAFRINATFLYGHSQGSFFAFHYAGARPEAVQGVLGHASGVWTWTTLSPESHHQAIVLMHGTNDPVVRYGQSVGGYQVFKKRGYPILRLRSLEGWNHWPAEQNGPTPHASQQLAWIEGMTTRDPERLAAVFKTFGTAKDKSQHDFAAYHQVACRVRDMEGLPAGAMSAANKVIGKVEDLVEKHLAALADASPDATLEADDAAWIGHLPMFLRNFSGVPAADELRKKWEVTLEEHKAASSKHLGAYYTQLRAGKQGEAFTAGLEGLASAFLTTHTADDAFLKGMEELADKAKDLGLDKADTKRFKQLLRNYRKSLEDGRKSFESVNKRGAL